MPFFLFFLFVLFCKSMRSIFYYVALVGLAKELTVKIICTLFVCLMCNFVFVPFSAVAKTPAHAYEVLLINSYHPGHVWGEAFVQRIVSEVEVLEAKLGAKIRLRYEFLDADNYENGLLNASLRRVFALKYGDIDFDAVIILDDAALDFMLRYSEELFPSVPMVFCGATTFPQGIYENRSRIAAVEKKVYIDNILEAIRVLHTDTKHVVVIYDDMISSQVTRQRVSSTLDEASKEWNIIELSSMNIEDLKEAVKSLPEDSVLISFSYYHSKGIGFFTEDEFVQELSTWSSFPIYSPWEDAIGFGIIAGQKDNTVKHIKTLVSLLERILLGESPESIPLFSDANPTIVFDGAVLKEYGIDVKDLPLGAELINQPLSLYERYGKVLLPVSLLVLGLCFIILLLIYHLRMKQRIALVLMQEKIVLAREHELERRGRLAQRMEAIGRMAGGITHDVNNILGSISACAQLALSEIPKNTDAYEDVSRIFKGTERGKELMRRIRMTDSTQTMNICHEVISVKNFFEDCVDTLHTQLTVGISLKISEESQDCYIVCDLNELHQILSNLCINGIQAMQNSGGELYLSASELSVTQDNRASYACDLKVGNYVCIEVLDNGCGIDPKIMESIFDPFFTTRQGRGGTGLGLSQVHSLIQRNYGGIHVSSELGVGTHFFLYFPRSSKGEVGTLFQASSSEKIIHPRDSNSSVPQKKIESIAIESNTKKNVISVLIVDDEPEIRYALANIVRRLGLNPISEADAENALKYCTTEEKKFQLIISDQILPGIQGLDFVRQWRTYFPHTPVILCSGFSGIKRETFQVIVNELGNIHILTKPFDILQMESAIKKALHNN